MGFDPEWEQRYAEKTHLSVWPWSDIVSLVNRHCKPLITEGGRVLELGCGAGANIPFFRNLGLDYHAIDGSKTIVNQLHERYPDSTAKILIGDFTLEWPFKSNFDLIVDRASLTHNNTLSIIKALQFIFNSLEPGGVFIGSDWFSKNHSDYSLGQMGEDEFTKKNFTTGQFSGVWKVHFSDEFHLRNLFSKFEFIYMEENLLLRHEPQDNHQFASWNIVARKRHD